jgi:L-serine dehydratase
MESIKKIYKIGNGPSSSHTMGPKTAAGQFKSANPDVDSYRVTLFGSLAATGIGHLTDKAIINTLHPAEVELIWKPEIFLPFHPNGMLFEAIRNGISVAEWKIYSVGGGKLANENTSIEENSIYCLNLMSDILERCEKTGKSFWEYVQETEENDIWDYLNEVWKVMYAAVQRGIDTEGVLPGGLGLRRKASSYYFKAQGYKDNIRTRALVFSYALACSEENAGGGTVVTAPTCGSCGVLPAILFHLKRNHDFSDSKILKALATAGLFGNVVKENASISGAEVGCQGEIGVACAMAAAAANQLFGGTPAQIEYAAEMGLEHHLGLTCDPVCGLVQIPCIERNAFAAARALDANTFAMLSDGKHRVAFDKVVETMNQTGHDLPSLYKETSTGGLARFIERN